MTEAQPVFNLIGIPIYGYGICVAIAVLAGLLLALHTFSHSGLGKDNVLTLCLLAVPMGLLGARAMYCLVNLQYILVDVGAGFIPRLWTGGYALYGAIPGVALAAFLYARHINAKPATVLDSIAPAGALILCICRCAEAFTNQGLGDYVMEAGILQSFPFSVQNLYGEYQLAVFLYEAAAALIICIVLWRMAIRKDAPAGRTALYFLLLLGLTQIQLESLREDDFLRFGFVRFNQLASMACILLAAIAFGREHKGRWRTSHTVRCVLIGVCIPLLVAIEFALDKSSLDIGILYALMAVILWALLILISSLDLHRKKSIAAAL